MIDLTAGTFTPNWVIRFALQDCGLLERGQDPDSEEYADLFNRLNELIIYMQIGGLKLWLQQLIPVNLVAGQALYVFSPTGDVVMSKPSRIVDGYFQDSTGNQRPLIALSWNDWNKLSNKTQTGQINSYFVDNQASVLNCWFWLTPDANAATGTAQMQTQIQQPTSTALTDLMVFPPEWGIALHWGLAAQICTGQPSAVIDRCEKMAMLFSTALEDWNVEQADTSFAPDSRMMSRFGQRSM